MFYSHTEGYGIECSILTGGFDWSIKVSGTVEGEFPWVTGSVEFFGSEFFGQRHRDRSSFGLIVIQAALMSLKYKTSAIAITFAEA
jgi:hypothetical protein